ncbi:MAG: SOS response-associated peptidase [Pseudomonadota bacterium]
MSLDRSAAPRKTGDMCGRFALVASSEEISQFLDLQIKAAIPPLYNIAPTQPINIAANFNGKRGAMLVRWGLIPGWVKDPDDFPTLINARSETAATKPSFRTAMRHRRALIPVTGFYEWKRPPAGSKGKSQAYLVRPRAGGIVALAGLWENWMGPDGTEIDTGCILTTAANDAFAPIHDRLPVAIEPDNFDAWLNVQNSEPRDVQPLLTAPHDEFWEAVPIGDAVNKVANATPDVQKRVEPKVQDPDQPPAQMDLL